MGADEQAWSTEDVAYVCDLRLVAQETAGPPRIANPIYAEEAVTEARGGIPAAASPVPEPAASSRAKRHA